MQGVDSPALDDQDDVGLLQEPLYEKNYHVQLLYHVAFSMVQTIQCRHVFHFIDKCLDIVLLNNYPIEKSMIHVKFEYNYNIKCIIPR